MKKYLGIDLGGTNVRVAEVDEDGNVLKIEDSPSYAMSGPEKIVSNILDMIAKFDLSEIEGIGIGVPGPVDENTNMMTMSTNLPGMDFYPFAKQIEEATGKRVVVNNDANVAGVAEAAVGAGRGYKVVYYVTQSTGIGGALVIDGHIVTGRNGYGGEIANIVVRDDGQKYNHLHEGAVENEASGTALGREGYKIFGSAGDTGHKVFDLARSGNKEALELVDQMAKYMGRLLGTITLVCAPDCFVFGGGCSKSSDLYFDKMRDYMNEYVHAGNQNTPIFKAQCKEPGVIGAAMLAKAELG